MNYNKKVIEAVGAKMASDETVVATFSYWMTQGYEPCVTRIVRNGGVAVELTHPNEECKNLQIHVVRRNRRSPKYNVITVFDFES